MKKLKSMIIALLIGFAQVIVATAIALHMQGELSKDFILQTEMYIRFGFVLLLQSVVVVIVQLYEMYMNSKYAVMTILDSPLLLVSMICVIEFCPLGLDIAVPIQYLIIGLIFVLAYLLVIGVTIVRFRIKYNTNLDELYNTVIYRMFNSMPGMVVLSIFATIGPTMTLLLAGDEARIIILICLVCLGIVPEVLFKFPSTL